jgi:hypothetical protein
MDALNLHDIRIHRACLPSCFAQSVKMPENKAFIIMIHVRQGEDIELQA